MTLRTPLFRAACNTLSVPFTLTLWVPIGSWTGARNACPGRRVEHRVGALRGRGDEVGIRHRAFDQGCRRVEIGSIAGREVVQRHHFMAQLQEPIDEMGADESASSGDNVFHGSKAETGYGPRSHHGRGPGRGKTPSYARRS